MGKGMKVISRSDLSVKLPIIGTLVWALVLDRLNAPHWIWFIYASIYFFAWILALWELMNEEEIDIDFDKLEKK